MKAQMQITGELLADMLNLPYGTKILDAKMDPSSPAPMIILTVEHESILADYVEPKYQRVHSQDCSMEHVVFIGWL
jgi:hypothetical protein